jgi:hypothetical protein
MTQVPQLQVTGTGVQVNQQQQYQQSLLAQPASYLATRQQHRLAQHRLAALPAAAVPPSSCAGGCYLGCGVAWSQLATQAALVAKRSLHHTNKEREQQR